MHDRRTRPALTMTVQQRNHPSPGLEDRLRDRYGRSRVHSNVRMPEMHHMIQEDLPQIFQVRIPCFHGAYRRSTRDSIDCFLSFAPMPVPAEQPGR
jgi:hypothetical protein